MEVLKVNHLGIAPKDNNLTKKFFKMLNLESEGAEKVEDQKVEVDFYKCGETRLELLEPTDSTSPIQKFLDKKGSGIHHIALEVDDVKAWIAHLVKQGIEMIDKEPRLGAHNTQIAFVHPRATGGILVELVQEKSH